MMILEDHTHHLVAVVAVRVLTVIVLTESLTVLAATVTVRARIVITQAGTRTVTGMSEIIIAGTETTTGPGIQKNDVMTEGIVKVAGTGAPALIIGAEAGAEAGTGGAGAGAKVGAGAGTSSVPVHSGTEIKRRLQSQAT
jgi:hypothetical protein